jgi:hypothetical protein
MFLDLPLATWFIIVPLLYGAINAGPNFQKDIQIISAWAKKHHSHVIVPTDKYIEKYNHLGMGM